MTKLPVMRERSVVRSSVIPSAKYSCSGSLLRLVKGSITTDSRGGDGSPASGELPASPPGFSSFVVGQPPDGSSDWIGALRKLSHSQRAKGSRPVVRGRREGPQGR